MTRTVIQVLAIIGGVMMFFVAIFSTIGYDGTWSGNAFALSIFLTFLSFIVVTILLFKNKTLLWIFLPLVPLIFSFYFDRVHLDYAKRQDEEFCRDLIKRNDTSNPILTSYCNDIVSSID